MTKPKQAIEAKSENAFAFASQLLRVPELASGEDYFDEALRSYSRSCLEIARAGACWAIAKEQLGHGKFTAAIEKAGLGLRSVQHAMQLAEFLGKLPENEARKLAQQPHTKVLALAQADPEVLEDIIESGDTDDLVGLSVRQLKDKLRAAEKAAAQAQTKLDTALNLNKQLSRAGQALQTEQDLPMFALTVRQESMALTDQIGFAMENLEAIAEEHLFQELKHPEAHRWQPVAASTCYHALAGVAARAQALLKRIGESYEVPERVGIDEQLTPAEIKRHLEARELLLAQHNTAAKRRENERENSIPGKRGAKRK